MAAYVAKAEDRCKRTRSSRLCMRVVLMWLVEAERAGRIYCSEDASVVFV